MNTGITPKKKTPSFSEGFLFHRGGMPENSGVVWSKKHITLDRYLRNIEKKAGRSYCHGCAAFLSRSIMAIPIPVSGKGSAIITSTSDSCNS
jgi:hypothetical protein